MLFQTGQIYMIPYVYFYISFFLGNISHTSFTFYTYLKNHINYTWQQNFIVQISYFQPSALLFKKKPSALLVQRRDAFLSFSTKSSILIKLMVDLMNEIENKVIKISRV
jgi:hypothetical protein